MLFDEIIASRTAQLLVTLLVLIFLNVVGRMVIDVLIRRIVRADTYENATEERKREQTIVNVFNATFTVLLVFVGIFVALSILRVNIAALLTGAGVFGVVFGLGAQSTIKNYLAGIYILSENQYRVGDIISLSGGALGPHTSSGVVEEITLRVTKLRDQDGTLSIISNGDAGVIANKSFKFGNVVMNLDISYDSDIDTAEKIINQTGQRMSDEKKWQPMIIEPITFLRVEDFTQGGVLVKVTGKVTPGDQWAVAGEFRRRLKKGFDKKGIEFAVPEQVVHSEITAEQEEEAAAEQAETENEG